MTCIYILKINNNNIGYYFNYDLARDFLYSCYYANFIKDTDKVVIETFKQNTNIKIHSENIYFTISTNTKLDNNNTNNKIDNNTNNKIDNDLESFSNSSNSTKTSCSFIDNILSEDESETDSDEPDTNYISSEFESESTIASVESTFYEFMKKRDDNKKKNKLMNDIGQEKIDVTYHINLLKQEKKRGRCKNCFTKRRLSELENEKMSKMLDEILFPKKSKDKEVVKKTKEEDDDSKNPISKILIRNIEAIKRLAEKENISIQKLIKYLKQGE
jgi:hypothetical protein